MLTKRNWPFSPHISRPLQEPIKGQRRSPRNQNKKTATTPIEMETTGPSRGGGVGGGAGGYAGKEGGATSGPEGYLTSYVMKDGSASYVVSLGEPAQPSPTKRLNVTKNQQPVFV